MDQTLSDPEGLVTDLPVALGPAVAAAAFLPEHAAPGDGEILKSDIEALLNLRLGKLAAAGRNRVAQDAETCRDAGMANAYRR